MIKAIIGLGNPGPRFLKTRHNIGFRILDALARKYGGQWKSQGNKEVATVSINGHDVILVKPQTFMNNSGEIMASLTKQGIKPENVLVVHDELELPFGAVKPKLGGSSKGHNGLKSIITYIGDTFHRIRVGIGRPENRDEVADYVLKVFEEEAVEIEELIEKSVQALGEYLADVA
jgi:PTH1 family peptidyl-tRNA hydrolase